MGMETASCKMTKTLPFVSIITVNYNGRHLLKDCFKSLLALYYPKKNLEIAFFQLRPMNEGKNR